MMFPKAQLLLGLASLTPLIAGAALPEPLAEASAEPSTNAPSSLERREVNGANCWKYKDPSNFGVYYAISTWGTWDQDWGKGLLDNLRGSCSPRFGAVKDWGFGYEPGEPPTKGYATFWFPLVGVYWDHCVLDAIWLASNAAGQSIEGASCWESDKWW